MTLFASKTGTVSKTKILHSVSHKRDQRQIKRKGGCGRVVWFGLILCISLSTIMQKCEYGSIDWRQLIMACVLYFMVRAILFGL